jgi:tyrosyl-tRNA synthetase
MLTEDEVMANSHAILDQFFKILDPERTEIRRQTEWFDNFKLDDVVRLAARVTVAQIMERDDFSQRFRTNQPIGLHELYYPLLQGYDSVAVQSDVEFGGTDQKFNNLVGRELQREFGMKCGPAGQGQAVFLVPLIVGLDGVKKMSQSLDNYVAINDPPNDMFGKLMSVPDPVIPTYLETLTNVPDDEIEAIRISIEERTTNPMEHKLRMAREIVTQFHGAEAAEAAQSEFRRVFSEGAMPGEVREHDAGLDGEEAEVDMVELLASAGLASSKGEARRLISQGAVEIDGAKAPGVRATVRRGAVIRVGKHRFVRISG